MKPNASNLAALTRESNAAEDVLAAITLDDADETVAHAAVGWLMTRYLPTWKFSVHGGDPLAFDWKYKGRIGIKTDDPERARQWLFDALMLDYRPMVHYRLSDHNAHSCGGIKDIRAIYLPHQGRQKDAAADPG